MKIFIILLRVAPIDLRIAISLVFSITTMIKVPTILNAATRIMRVRMMNITIFSNFRAEKRFLFILIQSLLQ